MEGPTGKEGTTSIGDDVRSYLGDEKYADITGYFERSFQSPKSLTQYPVTSMTDDNTRPLTVGEWFVTMLILALPLVNIIMFFVWAFGGGGNINRRNYCRAGLIWVAIAIVIGIGFAIIAALVGVGAAAAASSGGY